MDIMSINRQTLYNLYEQFPESFKELSLDGNNLVYQGMRVDISKFNINDLLSGDISFAASLSVLSSEDIFKIVRIHVPKGEKKQASTNSDKPLSFKEYRSLLSSKGPLNDEQENNLREYYENIGNLITYEDYLLEYRRHPLNTFRSFIFDLESGNQNELSEKEKKAIDMYHELSEPQIVGPKHDSGEVSINDENGKKLELVCKANDSSGFISTLQIITIIVGISIIFTIITLYIIK